VAALVRPDVEGICHRFDRVADGFLSHVGDIVDSRVIPLSKVSKRPGRPRRPAGAGVVATIP